MIAVFAKSILESTIDTHTFQMILNVQLHSFKVVVFFHIGHNIHTLKL